MTSPLETAGAAAHPARPMREDLGPPPPLPDGALRVIPLGGLGAIGRNMTVFEHQGRLLVVDCGVLFPDTEQPGVDLILPDFAAILSRLDDIEAIVLTHGHEDHIGAVPYLLAHKPDIPLVGSQFTLALVEAKLAANLLNVFLAGSGTQHNDSRVPWRQMHNQKHN
jgi:ribonuclease J